MDEAFSFRSSNSCFYSCGINALSSCATLPFLTPSPFSDDGIFLRVFLHHHTITLFRWWRLDQIFSPMAFYGPKLRHLPKTINHTILSYHHQFSLDISHIAFWHGSSNHKGNKWGEVICNRYQLPRLFHWSWPPRIARGFMNINLSHIHMILPNCSSFRLWSAKIYSPRWLPMSLPIFVM